MYKETRYIHLNKDLLPYHPYALSLTLKCYKGKRTQQQLFANTQQHKAGSSSINQALSPTIHPDHFWITKNIANVFIADPINQTESNDNLNKPPKCILIEGAPGIGKTTLAKDIAYHWAKKEILLNIELLLLVYLRDPRLQVIESVKQLLELFTSTKIAVDIADYLQECNGNGVAFVIDGFDEYPVLLHQRSFIVDLISGKILHKAMVVVTSRPTATVSLDNQVDRRIDILGFAKEEQKQYIMQSLREYPQKIAELFNYLNCQPAINSLCYVPLHLKILLFLFQKGYSLPLTLTEMIESFIIQTVNHFSHFKYLENVYMYKLLDLPTPIFNVVCKLAFCGLQENKLMFTLDEIRELCHDTKDTLEAVNGFGLLHVIQHYPQEGALSFTFLHYTIQEFLAAVHVSTLSDEEQSLLIKQTFWTENFNCMWMMYVGIVGVDSSPLATFVSNGEVDHGIKISDNILNDKRKCLHLFKCYAEAKVVVEELQVSSNIML